MSTCRNAFRQFRQDKKTLFDVRHLPTRADEMLCVEETLTGMKVETGSNAPDRVHQESVLLRKQTPTSNIVYFQLKDHYEFIT